MVSSKYIKGCLASYYRFGKQCHIWATEAGRYSSDFLAYTKQKKLTEIEIKVSKSDLNADFKKDKHRIYSQAKGAWVPHEFYFCVPEELVEHAISKCIGKYQNYGVMVALNPMTKQAFKAYCRADQESLDRRLKWITEDATDIDVTTIENGQRYQITYNVMGAKPVQQRIRIVKRAKPLHIIPTPTHVLHTIIARTTSELAGKYQDIVFTEGEPKVEK